MLFDGIFRLMKVVGQLDNDDRFSAVIWDGDGGSGSGGGGSGNSSSVTGNSSSVTELSGIGEKLLTLVKKILGPALAIIGVAGVIYAIVLGVKYAKAEDADARKKVQGRLIGAIIGAAIIIVGATLCFALNWESIFESFSGVSVGE